jgi:hypothetical protein
MPLPLIQNNTESLQLQQASKTLVVKEKFHYYQLRTRRNFIIVSYGIISSITISEEILMSKINICRLYQKYMSSFLKQTD